MPISSWMASNLLFICKPLLRSISEDLATSVQPSAEASSALKSLQRSQKLLEESHQKLQDLQKSCDVPQSTFQGLERDASIVRSDHQSSVIVDPQAKKRSLEQRSKHAFSFSKDLVQNSSQSPQIEQLDNELDGSEHFTGSLQTQGHKVTRSGLSQVQEERDALRESISQVSEIRADREISHLKQEHKKELESERLRHAQDLHKERKRFHQEFERQVAVHTAELKQARELSRGQANAFENLSQTLQQVIKTVTNEYDKIADKRIHNEKCALEQKHLSKMIELALKKDEEEKTERNEHDEELRSLCEKYDKELKSQSEKHAEALRSQSQRYAEELQRHLDAKRELVVNLEKQVSMSEKHVSILEKQHAAEIKSLKHKYQNNLAIAPVEADQRRSVRFSISPRNSISELVDESPVRYSSTSVPAGQDLASVNRSTANTSLGSPEFDRPSAPQEKIYRCRNFINDSEKQHSQRHPICGNRHKCSRHQTRQNSWHFSCLEYPRNTLHFPVIGESFNNCCSSPERGGVGNSPRSGRTAAKNVLLCLGTRL